MRNIRFSIIVPVYNVEAYLKRCLDSLAGQTYKNIEIILVDDGSTDSCPEICDEYAGKDPRMRACHKKNGGLSDARNFGMERARGEYIIFVDSDDYIKENACETFYETIIAHPGADIIAANIERVGVPVPSVEMYSQTKEIVSGQEFLKFQLEQKTMFVSACRNIYRRNFLSEKNLRFRSNIYHEDEEWTPRVFLQAETVICTDCVFYNHFIRKGSITQQKHTKKATDIICICDILRQQYMSIKDSKLKTLLMNYLVTLYLHAFYNGKLLGSKYRNSIDKIFLKEMALTKRNKRRVALFCFNRYLYYGYYALKNHIYSCKSSIMVFLKRKLK